MVDTCWLKKEGSFKDELAPDSGPRPSTSQQTLKWCKNVGCRLILLDCLMRQMTQESPSLIGLSKSLDTHLPLSRKCHPIFEQLNNIMQHFCINHSDLSFLHYPVWQFLSFTVLRYQCPKETTLSRKLSPAKTLFVLLLLFLTISLVCVVKQWVILLSNDI